MVNPAINPEGAYQEAYYDAKKHLPDNPVLDQMAALVYAAFAIATGLFAIAAAITKVAEVLARKK